MSMVDAEHWSLLSELERKALETGAQLEAELRRGEISEEAYRVALYTINGMTRGLIDEEINFAADEMIRSVESTTTQSRVFSKGAMTVILSKVLGEDCFEVKYKGKAKCYTFEMETDPVEAAHDGYIARALKLIGDGWRELK